MDANFCRRCGSALINKEDHVYVCAKGHVIYFNSSPAAILGLVNDKREALLITRLFDPGKGKLALPGGFCDAAENIETTLERETSEEIGLSRNNYDTPQYFMSMLDDYKYKGETISVMCAFFWATIKPGAIITAGDDASDAKFLPFDKIDQSRVQFRSQITALHKLQSMGVLK